MSKKRKADHLRLCLEKKVEIGSNGLEDYSFTHRALPEIDFEKIDLSVNFLGKKLKAPILISSLTGGTGQAKLINQRLAKAANQTGVALALGSQRIAIENLSLGNTFQVRALVPDIPLLANLGAVQLNYGFGLKECREAVRMIKADGLILHLNPLQEVIQPEGNSNFSSLLEKIEKIVKDLEVPVLVKEVGAGISGKLARDLKRIGVAAVETAGWGGTNWALIESYRKRGGERLGKIFSQWGIKTSETIIQCSKVKGLKIIGSGGIRTGIEAAKALSLGADLIGIGLPFLRPALISSQAVEEKIDNIIEELKIAMFCLGVKNISQLKKVKTVKN